MAIQYVYFFGGGKAEGTAAMKDLLGGKGANLAEMVHLGIQVPAGFTITTEVCTYFMSKHRYPAELRDEVLKNLGKVEEVMGCRFGDSMNPLLLSVRSGARESMPGMMETVLNLGLNEETIPGLIHRTNNPRFVWDAYRRFIQMYTNVVMHVHPEELETILGKFKDKKKAAKDTDLSAEDMQELIGLYLKRLDQLGAKFPTKPMDQLWGGISAVFESWDIPRAVTYRKLNQIPDEWGTACSVQSMVFGNMGDDSATGVAFTRDPSTGERSFFGEWLPNAQGEDVVAGIRTPYPINKSQKKHPDDYSLEEHMPGCYNQLVRIYNRLEQHFKDMQDIEFTIQHNKLWMLQTRTGKRTGFAAVRMAVEMTDEKLITKEEAVRRVKADALIQLLAPIFDPREKTKVIKEGRMVAKGLNAGPGAASGRVAFSAEEADKISRKGPALLVRLETSPDDIHGMAVSQGILTARGGMTSHAALVARGMGKPCVVGCAALNINYEKKSMVVSGKTVKQGDWLSIDGTTGEVIIGQLKTNPSEVVQVLIEKKMKPEASKVFQNFQKILSWADELRKIGVRCNADTPKDTAAGFRFGAAGIGLCRTEHMFFEGTRIDAVREMILAEDSAGRVKALNKLLPMQRGDFIKIFKEMPGLPIIIRLLDPPLHEFLPHTDKEINSLARKMRVAPARLKDKITQLHEFNPMLGLRGCRLGVTYPEIYDMQVKAIMEAACEVKNKAKIDVKPEIMIPLVGHVRELSFIRERAEKICKEIMEKTKVEMHYLIGTMIEIPRAALTAEQVAEYAEFFSFGTNDLTQTTLGMSRDDAGSFLPHYVNMGIYKVDPFESIDQTGVGRLMQIAVERGRRTRPEIEVGICGEHGGEAASVEFCHRIGLNYVSCSPYRVPVARMAAAHAALKEQRELEAKQAEAVKEAKLAKAKAKEASKVAAGGGAAPAPKPKRPTPVRAPFSAAAKAQAELRPAPAAPAKEVKKEEKKALPKKVEKKPALQKPAPIKVEKKATPKKPVTKPAPKKMEKKATPKKPAPKPAPKKAPVKKVTASKPAAKKIVAKKPAPKVAAKQKPKPKKAVQKKIAKKKPAPKKAVQKKAPPKKAAKKAVIKKAPPKKVAKKKPVKKGKKR